MTVTAVNDSVTYKGTRGDTERSADMVVAVNKDGTAIGGAGSVGPVAGADGATAASITNALPVEITDGTNGVAAVKAASTAAIATDKALVVSISPNGANSNGRATAANSTPVVLSTADQAGDYETVAASQTAQVMGSTGAIGDFIKRIHVVPATVAPGVVTLLDNATSIPVWVGGTVGADLKPFAIELGMVSVSGAWKITTGANLSVIAIGKFT